MKTETEAKLISLAPIGVAALVAVGALWYVTHQHRALGEAVRAAEAAQLALKQQIVADSDTKQELQASVKDLLAQNDLLREAYEGALRAAPDAKPESTARLVTAPVTVLSGAAKIPEVAAGGDADHPPAPPPCDRPLASDGAGSFYCPDPDPTPPKIQTMGCVLTKDSTVSFKVDEVVLNTDKGNRLVTGTAEVWRETPAPRSKLSAAKFSSSLSDADALATPPPPRWGVEVLGACRASGCGLGAGVLLPPWRLPLLGWRLEARAGVVLGPETVAIAALGARF